jgi:hypothetical protein
LWITKHWYRIVTAEGALGRQLSRAPYRRWIDAGSTLARQFRGLRISALLALGTAARHDLSDQVNSAYEPVDEPAEDRQSWDAHQLQYWCAFV